MSSEDHFTAWAGVAKGEPLKQIELKLKEWDDDSVEMEVSHCGICGSDIHTLDSDWSATKYPICVGHEIVGKVTRVGKNVTNLVVGDRAGVGAQSGSCGECTHCKEGMENVCFGGSVGTYNGTWKCGTPSSGGYSNKWRGDYRFAFKVPDNLPSEVAATFFCGGATLFAPLKRHNVNSESVVGILGIGGLGHYGILFAKAMGAKVIGMSHSDAKAEVAKELGCDDFIVTSSDESMAKYKKQLTHIVCTGTSRDFSWNRFFTLLKANGHFINVSAPGWDFPQVGMELLRHQVNITGSMIASPAEIIEMLDFAAEHNIRPWIKTYPMSKVNEAIQDFRDGKPRFRFVLEN
ncbi:NADP-dependent alcohol dehydrogenase [Mucor ambiguus]|uniref:NADP-dependent alcohol dehydrogenase n=1 Tax=Mucor ambiguus TaxID=91626 RepID=A0A0C9MC98_9FUNG|nr:NADP-dependent alcohol dehydrogenase [Mucor ambiguus]